MSGPITVVITAEPITTLLAAAAIHAAEAVRAGYAEAAAIAATTAATEARRRAERQAASGEAHAAAIAEATALEQRVDDLLQLAARLGASLPATACPPRPTGDDPARFAAWRRATAALAAELETLLRHEAACRSEHLAEADIAIVTAPADPAAPPSQRWLQRVVHLGPPPEEILAVAREFDATPPGERADLLAGELRRRIQLHAEGARRQAVQVATAGVVEATLKDLGYQVDGIAETLFVEGGVAHFRRPGWGDYLVRLRADAGAATVNFNVVRAVDGAANERSVLDHLAEDRWCAEFPALMRALEARGVQLQVTRRLEAGELPVQCVARDRLPHFADDETPRPATQPKTREIR